MTRPEATVMLVDDEPAVRTALGRALELEGYTVLHAGDGAHALHRLQTEPVDAIVADVTMPVLDGLAFCRALRARGTTTPVLMLTALQSVDDRVAGLDAGADDYLPKPFALRELLARLRALLRRVETPAVTDLAFADLRMLRTARQVLRGDRLLDLSRTEYLLAEVFLERPLEVLERPFIFERVWGYDFGPAANGLAVYMGYLRRKTEEHGEPRLFHTVRGMGYVLREGA
ncbi:MAG: response regulator transcription factor [Solirubrobacteraceae bacterium]|nr:response regulator transcription factor [Patulibacter sp.]